MVFVNAKLFAEATVDQLGIFVWPFFYIFKKKMVSDKNIIELKSIEWIWKDGHVQMNLSSINEFKI